MANAAGTARGFASPITVITLGSALLCLYGSAFGQSGSKPAQKAPFVVQVAPDLVVRSQSYKYTIATQTHTFQDGVVATYDVTTVHADSLVVHAAGGEETATAEGHVHIDDPVGMAMADSVTFTWKLPDQKATGRNVMIHIGNVMLRASRGEFTRSRWDLWDVDASSCNESPPLFLVHTPHITVRPGSDGVIRKPTLQILGVNTLTIPDESFTLDSRTQGLQYPSISYHAGQGVGVALKEGTLVSPTVNLAGDYGAIHGSLPGYGGVITDSLLPNAAHTSILTPSSDFSERFRYGYLDNVNVVSPSQESRFLDTPRNSVSLGTAWNSFIIDRPDPIAYTKPIEGIFEAGGKIDGFGFLGQARFQDIQQYRQAFHERVLLSGSLGLKPRKIAHNLSAIARLDTEAFVGNDFGWAKATAGLVYKPVKQLTLAAGGFTSLSAGHPLYPIDELYAEHGGLWRADVDLGPTKISYLAKWDTHLGWFDKEYTIRQVVGCLEPFLSVREFPRSYDLGIRLRLDEFYDVLRRRHFERPESDQTQMVISP